MAPVMPPWGRTAARQGKPVPGRHRGHAGGDRGHRVEARTPLEKGLFTMKLNPREILFGEDTKEKTPVLLAVTPPRTGERTLLGVENLLQSIAVPEPFSLELAGDMDGVTLMARCLDGAVVRSQLSAHYPQARIRRVDEEDDPMRTAEGEEAWAITLRADGPEYIPLRTFRDDDLLDPGSDPLIALMGAISELREGERVVSRLMLRSPRPRLVPVPSREGPQASRLRAEGARLHLPDQASADGRLDHGRPGHRRPRRPQGLPVDTGRGDMEGGAPRRRHCAGAGRRRLGMVAVEEGPQPSRRPAAHKGKGLPHRLRRRAPGGCSPPHGHGAAPREGAPGAGGRRLPPLRQPCRSPLQGGQGLARGARPGGASPPGIQTVRAGAASWASARSPASGTRPARATRRPWWSGQAQGPSTLRQRA